MCKPVKYIFLKRFMKTQNSIVSDKVTPIKISLQEGEELLLLIPDQIIKIRDAKMEGKKSIILRFSGKQVQANTRHEGGFFQQSCLWLQKFYLLY